MPSPVLYFKCHKIYPLQQSNDYVYSQVLKFISTVERDSFVHMLESFLNSHGIENKRRELVESYILRNTVTRKHRQERLNKFFKKIFKVSPLIHVAVFLILISGKGMPGRLERLLRQAETRSLRRKATFTTGSTQSPPHATPSIIRYFTSEASPL